MFCWALVKVGLLRVKRMHCSVVPMLYYCSVRSEETGEIFKPIFHASAIFFFFFFFFWKALYL